MRHTDAFVEAFDQDIRWDTQWDKTACFTHDQNEHFGIEKGLRSCQRKQGSRLVASNLGQTERRLE